MGLVQDASEKLRSIPTLGWVIIAGVLIALVGGQLGLLTIHGSEYFEPSLSGDPLVATWSGGNFCGPGLTGPHCKALAHRTIKITPPFQGDPGLCTAANVAWCSERGLKCHAGWGCYISGEAPLTEWHNVITAHVSFGSLTTSLPGRYDGDHICSDIDTTDLIAIGATHSDTVCVSFDVMASSTLEGIQDVFQGDPDDPIEPEPEPQPGVCDPATVPLGTSCVVADPGAGECPEGQVLSEVTGECEDIRRELGIPLYLLVLFGLIMVAIVALVTILIAQRIG